MKIVLFVMLLGVISNVFGMDGNGKFQPDLPPRVARGWEIPGLRGATRHRPDLFERMYGAGKENKPKKPREREQQQAQPKKVTTVVPDTKSAAPEADEVTAGMSTITLDDVKEGSLQTLIDSIQAEYDEKNTCIQQPDEKVLAIIASHFDGAIDQSQFWNKLRNAMREAGKGNMTITLEDFGKAFCWWFRHKQKHIDQITDKDKRTLLHERVLSRGVLRANDNKKMCEFLLAAGASIDCRDGYDTSPLMAAIDGDCQEIYEFFFERFSAKAYEELKEFTRRRELKLREGGRDLTGVDWYGKYWRCYYTIMVKQLKALLPAETFEFLMAELTIEVFLREVQKEIAQEIDLASA